MKKVRYRSSGKKGQVTVVGCASAAGQATPSMVIFNAKRLNPEWTKGEFLGTTSGLSDNGWINSELFEAWMSEHFHMLFQLGHCCCSWTAIVHITSHKFYGLSRRMMR